MKAISELTSSLNVHFRWNKARIECFSKMLLGLFTVNTVNLKKIAVAFASDAQLESRYKRLKRFFAYFEMDIICVGLWIFNLYFSNEQKFYLAMDRTNWYFGKSKINIFMLALTYEGVAIPVYWKLLPKAGSSNVKEQKELLAQFINRFDKNRIAGLLADREFGSGKLFKWLKKKNIPFYIRIKEGTLVNISGKKFKTAKKLFNQLEPKTHTYYPMTVWVFGQKIYLAGSRSERGELMIVATNQDPRIAIACYLRRWEIETLFSCLKGRGFHFEETHLTNLDRIEKLMALLAIGVAWAHPQRRRKFHRDSRRFFHSTN